MDKWFVILLGLLVISVHLPAIVAPARYHEWARRLATKSFFRRFSLAPIAIGIMAILVSDQSDIHHQILFAIGLIETIAGICFLILPSLALPLLQFLLSKSLNIWILRGIIKCTIGILIITWGVLSF